MEIFIEQFVQRLNPVVPRLNPVVPRLNPYKYDQTDHRALKTWSKTIAKLISRAIPQVSLDWVRSHFVTPAAKARIQLTSVLDYLTKELVEDHIYIKQDVHDTVITLLEDCAKETIKYYIFRKEPKHDNIFDLEWIGERVEYLLFFTRDNHSQKGIRFINNDWRDLNRFMSHIDILMHDIGKYPGVMSYYLTLCEKAGPNVPTAKFIEHLTHALNHIPKEWMKNAAPKLAPRLADIIERYAGTAPLATEEGKKLLKILDILIDLGDRRSAELANGKLFRHISRTSR